MNKAIFLVSPLPPPVGGIATWTMNYLKWMFDKGYEVILINSSKSADKEKKSSKLSEIVKNIKRNLRIINEFKVRIKSNPAKIVHINSSCSNYGIIRDYFIARTAHNNKIKIVIHFHCNIEDQLTSTFSKRYFKKLCKLSDKIIVLNEKSSKYISNNLNLESTILPNFIDEPNLKYSKVIHKDIKTIGFVGHISVKKGIMQIFDVAKLFPEITFNLAGPIRFNLDDIEIPTNVVLMGSVNPVDVLKLLETIDIFLFPTHSEGFSLALLEAMSIGVPIITTDVGANLDMIESYGGKIVEINSSLGISRAINEMKSMKVRKEMSLWNFNKANNVYNKNLILPKLVTIYNNILKDKLF